MLPYPPPESWPEKTCTLPELVYPDVVNVCHELLDSNLERGRGPFPAIYFGDSVITYADLLDRVMNIAGALTHRGVGPGDRVILRLLNSPEFIATWLAILRIGAVVIATPPLLKARELGWIIDNCEPSLLVSEKDLWEEVANLHSDSVPLADVHSLSGATAYRGCVPTSRDTLAIVAYTSGSTGVPKGCMHSHGDLLAPTDSYARYVLQPTPEDRFGGHPTMGFVYGLAGLLLFPLRFGASVILLDRFTPEAFAGTIRRYQMTIAFCIPTSLRMMMRDVPDLKASVGSLRLAVTAGETLPASAYRAWVDQTGVEVLDGLGSTEMLGIFVSGRAGQTRPGVTGQAVPGYRAMVVDKETFEPAPDGAAGLIAVQGPTGCRYLSLPERQQQYVRNGWNLPGDVYVRDAEGFFHYQCRNDDLIVCGGVNIAGPEVEGVLLEHPAVSEVGVVASPDEIRGMVPKAFIVLRPAHRPSEDLKAELQELVKRVLAPYKYPRKIEFVPELPKTSTGKIRRGELRRGEFHV